MAVVVNKPIPEFESLATGGVKVSNQSHLGQTVVLYFYPKADTPGCTNEAKDFTALAPEFAALGCPVYGMSKDKPAKRPLVAALASE